MVVRQPFAGNQIPVQRFDSAALKLIGFMPAPNVAGSVAPTGVALNYLSNPVEPDNTDQGDLRIDHRISDKDSFFARFSMSDQSLTPPASIPPPLSAAAFSSGDWTNNTRQGRIQRDAHLLASRH